MIGLRKLCLGVVLATAYFGNLAAAQTPANVSVVSGTGQLVCPKCQNPSMKVFEPMVVLVTDSSGKPVSGAAIIWNIISAPPLSASLSATQTFTGSDGTTSNVFSNIFYDQRVVFSISASLPNSSTGVIFTLTASPPESFTQWAFAQITSGLYVTITGTAGGTGSPPIQAIVQDFTGKGISNVSVRLIPAPGYTPGASVSCATGSGADVGSVLTDDNGTATCTPVLGPVPGTGTYHVLIGGVANATINGTGPLGYSEFASEFIQVSPGAPGSIKLISGNGQSTNAGQALASPLVVETDTAAGNPVAGATVTWSVLPPGAAVLGSAASTSDSSGRVSNTVTLASTATGTVQVTAAVAGAGSVTFSVTVSATVSGLSKVSGDSQATTVGTAFALPLVVQATATSGQAASNVAVQFSVTTGSGTLSAANVTTDSNGRASVTVTAGSAAGTITVTASAAGFSVTFNLTAAPPGPAITSSSFVNGAGFFATDQIHSALTPCGVGTVIAAGVAPAIQGVVTGPMFGPLPYQLAQVAIAFGNSLAPLFNVANVNGQQQASFQVPCDLTPSESVPATVTVAGNSKTVNVAVRSAGPGIFQFGDSDGVQRAVIVRSDGSFASVNNPVHRGEVVRLYITGMGQVQPTLATNTVPAAGVDSAAQGTVVVAINNFGERVVSARRAPDLVGIDEIAFQVAADAPVGTGALYVAIYPVNFPTAGIQVSNLSWISIQ